MVFSHFFRKTLNSMLNPARHSQFGWKGMLATACAAGATLPDGVRLDRHAEELRPMKAIAAESQGNVVPGATGPRGDATSLFSLYARWFDVVPADTQERLQEAYRLRYQVYCVENTFEDAAGRTDGMETDEYDRHSVHSLLIHRPTGMVAGTVRLILPNGSGDISALPISEVCTDPALRDKAQFPPDRTAEISRFAVSKAFRRRITDATHPDMHFVDGAPLDRSQERRILTPNITLGLMKAIAEMSIRNGVTHLCAMMEPALLRLTSRLGIKFTPLGKTVEYHGIRQPCYAALADLGFALMKCSPEAHELVSDQGRYWHKLRKILPAE
jgi:N-acyl amino acid synthase of PEP-CTERM/exosortase system